MTIARELVTLLRYELDDSGLKRFNRALPGNGRVPGNVPGLPTPAVIAQTSNGLGRLGSVLSGLLAGISIVSATRIADEWAGVEGRVGLVTEGVQEQTQALDGLYAAAQRSRQAYGALAQVFQGVARNKKELGLTTDQALKLSETIGTAMTIGGGSAASQEAALMQLSQAMGTGTLRGEELNSIMEQAPRLAQAIAKAFDVPVGKLKELGEKGKLSSKVLAEGLLKQSAELRAEFERMPMTFSGAWVVLSNSLGRQIDKLNKASGAARVFYRVTSLVVDNLETIIKYVALIGSAALLTKLAYAARSIAAAGGLFAKMIARFGGATAVGVLLGTFLRMLAVAKALEYVFDDIFTWFQGGDSLLGDVIGPMSDWKWLVDGVQAGLEFIKNSLGGATETVTQFAAKWGLIAVIIFGVIAAIGAIPTLVLSIIVAWASVFNYVKQNWDSLIADTIYNIERLGNALKNLVPEGLRNFFSSSAPAGTGMAGTPSQPVIGPGGAAFGITPATMNRAPAGAAGSTTTNSPTIIVNATSSQPAAVAEAARRGTERGMGAAAVPNVEASR